MDGLVNRKWIGDESKRVDGGMEDGWRVDGECMEMNRA